MKIINGNGSNKFSPEGWDSVQSVAASFGLSGWELLDKLQSQQLTLIELEELEDLLDTIAGLEGLLSAKEEGTITWEKVKNELNR
ncbi:hypothetical protein [Oscillatoria salina]|uniref:hypothetical protein n=1 Tax=Oscillatoria salina TaxID=331517 RepID=UPI0013B75283|nr:hypothetical protein [Oscillatoria salina]MBZ8178781.1 hypothetical protein [Oscillatoria salina IIICB1]NET88226.1 hypothetical protein [Kamptonema sp. SIO1D9]